MERLIVDTGVLVAIERGRQIDATLLPDDADIAIAAITASELLVGVELADAQRRPARAATVDAILATFDVIAFDIDIARHHAALLAHARRAGPPARSARPPDRSDGARNGPRADHDRRPRIRRSPRRRSSRDPSALAIIAQERGRRVSSIDGNTFGRSSRPRSRNSTVTIT